MTSATAIELAWRRYAGGDLDGAIEAALQARGGSQHADQRWDACAALCWMYLEKGDITRAEEALLSELPLAPHHAAMQWHAGNLYLRKNDPALAAQHLSNALALDPGLDDAACALAWALHDLGRFADATAWVRHALGLRASPERQAQLGWLLLLQGQAADAVPLLQAALAAAPQLPTAYAHLGRALRETGETAAALQILRKGLEAFPTSVELLLAAGWLHHDRQEHAMAADLAHRATQQNPQSASAWHLLGACRLAQGNDATAAQDLAQAIRLDATNVDASILMALCLRRTQQYEQAANVLAATAPHAPEHGTLLALQAQVWLDLAQTDTARRQIHRLIAREPGSGNLWFLLAQSLKQLGRGKSAARAVRRALRLEPAHVEAWKFAAWLALDNHREADARACAQNWLKWSPATHETDIQAAFLLTACGDLARASAHAETAIARDAPSADAWHALGHVRHSQHRFDEAESCLRQALALSPQASSPYLRKLGWILRSMGRLAEAAEVFLQAAEAAPHMAISWQEHAETLLLCGDWDGVQAALAQALVAQPESPRTELLQAKLMAARGPARWTAATGICCALIRRHSYIPEAGQVLMDLAAQGCDTAQQGLRLLPRAQRLAAYHDALDDAQARSSHTVFCSLAQLAADDFPDDLRIATTALYAAGLHTDTSPHELARRLRPWQRRLVLELPAQTPSHNPPHLQAAPRVRIAYVAAHFHRSLLLGVLAAHDPSVVDIFLYCDIAPESLGELAQTVRLHPLRDQDLAASMHANRIDVAIDTVGIGGFMGQHQVLQAFTRRVAPVQCAWLGSWAGGADVYDCVFTDAQALPASAAPLYAEAVIRIDGGQWAWKPPLISPPVTPPPSLTSERVTLGCAVRAFRISAHTLETWARLLARLPQADLVLMGEHAGNASFRRELDNALLAAGVGLDRVRFQPLRPYADYLASYAGIDIVLDSFPANGGLCLLDALWMGVPVVSLAGQWMGERQGLSMLSAIGHPEWVASDAEHYITTVCELARQPQALAAQRTRLRSEMIASPLLDASRIARNIESNCLQLKRQASDVAQAATTKERARAVARRQLHTWLGQGQRLLLASSPASPQNSIDVSVVIVLFNQAGLSLQAFAALADQTGVTFETIIVDNASSDETGQLLARLDGATVIRNTDNVGFLHAANQGAAVARGRHIVFLNNDAMLHDHALRQGVCRLDGDARIGAVGGRIVLANGRLQEAGCIAYRNGSTSGYGRGEDPRASAFAFVRDVDFCSGAFLMVRKDLWQQLGGFDPVFAPAYYEDTDLCLRIQDAGYRVVYDPAIWLTHFEWGSSVAGADAVALMEGRRARFATRHQQRLSQRPEPQQAWPHRDRWRVHGGKRRILLIDNAVPHMAAGGGLPRARLMVQALAEHHLTVFPLWDCDDDWREVYASIPETVEVMLGLGAAELERFLEQRAGVYDVLVVSRPPNMAFVETLWSKRPTLFDGMRLVYDAEAIFALRDIGQAELRGKPMPLDKARQLLDAELALTRRADAVLSVSATEAEMFRAAGAPHVRLLSHAMETRSNPPGWDARRSLLFVGAIHPNTPNEDSLLWFLEHVTPILRGLDADLATISIVGDCTSEKVSRLAGDHVRLIGRVDDLAPWYDSHRVFVAPTRFGAGVPAKVIEAACNGIPVVATSLLVRQLGWQDGVEIASGDTPHAFAEAVATLYRNPQVWLQRGQAMAVRTRTQYAPQQFAATLASVIHPHRD